MHFSVPFNSDWCAVQKSHTELCWVVSTFYHYDSSKLKYIPHKADLTPIYPLSRIPIQVGQNIHQRAKYEF